MEVTVLKINTRMKNNLAWSKYRVSFIVPKKKKKKEKASKVVLEKNMRATSVFKQCYEHCEFQ